MPRVRQSWLQHLCTSDGTHQLWTTKGISYHHPSITALLAFSAHSESWSRKPRKIFSPNGMSRLRKPCEPLQNHLIPTSFSPSNLYFKKLPPFLQIPVTVSKSECKISEHKSQSFSDQIRSGNISLQE